MKCPKEVESWRGGKGVRKWKLPFYNISTLLWFVNAIFKLMGELMSIGGGLYSGEKGLVHVLMNFGIKEI